ncbi:MAG TPA: transposase DNA-binding-containing protein, partial [Flavobacterium sp.]
MKIVRSTNLIIPIALVPLSALSAQKKRRMPLQSYRVDTSIFTIFILKTRLAMRRHFTAIKDARLLRRSNLILDSLFHTCVHSIRQLTQSDSECKAVYRFLQNQRVSELEIIRNMSANCSALCKDKTVLCIQDTTEVNLYTHKNRVKKDESIGTTNAAKGGIGFLLHPGFV